MVDMTIDLTDMNMVMVMVMGMEDDIRISPTKSSPKCPRGRCDK
jgi:hypothetical protein